MNFHQELNEEARKLITRRWFFKQCGVGLGSIGLASLLNQSLLGAGSSGKLVDPLTPKPPNT